MNTTDVTSYASQLDELRVVTLTDGEVWSARDLMPFAGYAAWREFSDAITRAIASVNASGLDAADHFVGAPKMVQIGSGARREVEDVQLTRYGCYILFQNADARKPEIAAAQQYFATQTRRQELTQPELPTDYLSALRALVAKEEQNLALAAKVSEDAPKVAYVDEFVSPDDVILFKVAAQQCGLSEPEFRARLLAAKWVYRKFIGNRWSGTQQKYVSEYEWRAYADYADKFSLKPQHNAPRHHNGQVKQTLYIHAAAMPAIRLRFAQQQAVSA